MNYYLNIILEDSDNLVASYDSLGKLRTLYKRDMADFLNRNGVERILADQTCWYHYFTREDEGGQIVELSFSEVREEAA
jgi:hypothetical protein